MKLSRSHIFILLLLLITFGASAQQDGLVTGVIMEGGTVNRIGAAEVLNKRTMGSVATNDMGLFQIRALPGDTLVVFKSEFTDREIIVPAGQNLRISLNRSTTLNQVNIYGQSKKQEMDDIKKDFRDKGSFYAGKPPVLSYIFSPLTAVYELFGRTPKNARRFGKYYATELQQTEIDGFFNETLIQKHTDLKGKELEDFMMNYRPDYSVASKWTEYDAIKYIRDSYKKYTDTLKQK